MLISHHIAPLYGMPKQSLKHQLHYVSILLKNSSNLFIFHLQMAQHDWSVSSFYPFSDYMYITKFPGTIFSLEIISTFYHLHIKFKLRKESEK